MFRLTPTYVTIMYFRRSDDDSPEVTAMWAQFGGSIAHRVRLRQQEYVKGPIPSLRMLKSKKRHSFLLLWWPHTEIRANLFSFRKIFSLFPPPLLFSILSLLKINSFGELTRILSICQAIYGLYYINIHLAELLSTVYSSVDSV